MTRLVQIKKDNRRSVALVDEPNLRLLDNCSSIYELACNAISGGTRLSELARQKVGEEAVDYDLIYKGRSEWLQEMSFQIINSKKRTTFISRRPSFAPVPLGRNLWWTQNLTPYP